MWITRSRAIACVRRSRQTVYHLTPGVVGHSSSQPSVDCAVPEQALIQALHGTWPVPCFTGETLEKGVGRVGKVTLGSAEALRNRAFPGRPARADRGRTGR